MGDNVRYITLKKIPTASYRFIIPQNDPLHLLGDNPQIAVKSGMLWYTFANISPQYNNNRLRIYDGRRNEWRDVELLTGLYELDALGDAINRAALGVNRGVEVRNKKIRLDVDKSTFHAFLKLHPGYKVDFSIGDLHKLLGFEKKIYEEPFSMGPDIINITRNLDRIYVRCNLVHRSHQPDLRDMLCNVVPYGNPGEVITFEPKHMEFVTCVERDIRAIDIRITNADNELLHILEPMTLELAFRS